MILLNGKEVEFGTFPNGETLFRKDGLQIHSHNMVSFKYENDSDLIKLMFLKSYIDGHKTKNTLIVYYMPYSRMDRSENDSPFTLKYVANFINSLKFDYIEVIEPHSDVTCAVLNNARPNYVNYRLINKVMEEVGFDPNHDSIVFPDSGAQKRYSSLKFNNILIGNKKRDFETGRITSLDIIGEGGNGNTAIIVDDLSSYGGTFLITADVLKQKGFDNIYLLVGHAEDSIFKGGIFKEKSPITKVFTTNSIISTPLVWTNVQYRDKIKVYDIQDLISE